LRLRLRSRRLSTFMVALLTLILFFNSLFAEEFQKTGTTGFTFLNLPVSARYAAMGETGISMPNGQADG